MTRTPAKFQDDRSKLYEGLRSQDTQGKCWQTDEQTNEQTDAQTDGNLHA